MYILKFSQYHFYQKFIANKASIMAWPFIEMVIELFFYKGLVFYPANFCRDPRFPLAPKFDFLVLDCFADNLAALAD